MSGNKWRPTLRQMLRAGLTIVRDSRTTASARKKAIQYTSSGQQIQGTIYYPESDGRAPAVLLLHTASGLTPHEHAMAARLAREGCTALVIAYSSRTTGAVIENDQQRKQLEQITMDGLRALQADPRADANHTAVIGLSLRGYFATHVVTATEDIVPKAAVVYYGMYPIPESTVASLRVPLLILQGDKGRKRFREECKEDARALGAL